MSLRDQVTLGLAVTAPIRHGRARSIASYLCRLRATLLRPGFRRWIRFKKPVCGPESHE